VIFVDTSAWFASVVPGDPNFVRASKFLAGVDPSLLITTDYVLDETLTLLKMRGESRRTHELGRRVLEETICRLVWVQPSDVLKAWLTFDGFRDQDWSFTDCVSRAVMEARGIGEAFAFDEHFRQFGKVSVLP
jgi:predicted nucleic acid-binding protein